MSKVEVKICGDMLTFISAVKYEQFEKMQKYAPEQAVAVDEDGNETFKLGFTPLSTAEPTKFGFDYNSVNYDGKLMLQIPSPIQAYHDDPEAEKQIIADRYAYIINKVNSIESHILDTMSEINAIEDTVASSISVCGVHEAEPNDEDYRESTSVVAEEEDQ